MRLLVERSTLNRQISVHARNAGVPEQSDRFKEQAERDQTYATLIRDLLESRMDKAGVQEGAEQAATAE